VARVQRYRPTFVGGEDKWHRTIIVLPLIRTVTTFRDPLLYHDEYTSTRRALGNDGSGRWWVDAGPRLPIALPRLPR